MTIGADMPLKSQFDALVRDKGNDKHAPDRKSAKETATSSDFKTIVKISLSRPTFDKEDMSLQDEPQDVARADEDIAASPAAGAFGQAILAFEQLLDRQRHENAGQKQSAEHTKLAADAGAASSAVARTTSDLEGEEQAEALPDKKSERPAQRMTSKPGEPATAVSQTSPTQATPGVERSAVSEAGQITPDAPAKATSKEPAEKPSLPSADTASSNAPPAGPANVKTSTTLETSAPAAAKTVPVTGVAILSERTAGGSKTLVIQLQPVELGTVTARLRLTSEGMHIQLTAESREMAEHLASDHDALGKALQRAGVTDDASSVTISVVDRSGSASNAQTGQQNLTGQELQANGRANGQAHSAFQGAPDHQRSPGQQALGELKPNDHDEVSAKAGAEGRPSRGLVV